MNLSNNKGFGIIQVVIFAGALMTVSLGLMSIEIGSHKQNQMLDRKLDLGEIENIVGRLTSDDAACNCMFQGISIPKGATKVSLGKLKNGCMVSSASPLLKEKKPFRPDSNIMVKSIALKNISDLGVGVKKADLEIAVTLDVGSLKPITISPRIFGIQSNKIAYCITSGSESKAIINCAASNPRAIYVGTNVTFNGQKSNTYGCLPLTALQGPVGPVGPQGLQGI